MNYDDPQLRERLAAEYVLGTLHGRARRRFEALLAADASLRASVVQWENRLHPLSEHLPPQTPPARVWQQIQQRLVTETPPAQHTTPTATASRNTLWNNLVFWRGFGLAAAGILLGMTIMLMQPALHTAPEERMVVVTNQQAEPLWVISTQPNARKVMIKTMHGPGMGPDKACVLWLIWRDGTIQNMGELPERSGQEIVAMPKGMKRRPDKAEVAISIETAGRKLDKPQGQIIFKSHWTTI